MSTSRQTARLTGRHWPPGARSAYFGDANLDGSVQFDDFLAMADAFGGAGGWAKGDFDGDGTVEFSDFLLLADHFGKARISGAMEWVPEPQGCWSILYAIALLTVWSPRRHRVTRPVPRTTPIRAPFQANFEEDGRRLVTLRCEVDGHFERVDLGLVS